MNEKILQNLQKSLLAEKRLGFTNAGVLGGFANYCLQILRKIPINDQELFQNLKNYHNLSRQERANLIKVLMQTISIVEKDKLSKLEDNYTKKDIKETKTKNNDNLKLPIKYLKNVGPKRAKLLEKLGIFTINDLLWHLPKRYEDRSKIKSINMILPEENITILGIITNWDEIKSRKGLTIYKATISDGSGIIEAVWFNQLQVKKTLIKGTQVLINGKVESKFGKKQIIVNDFEIYNGMESLHTARIVPIYPGTEKISQKLLRQIIFHCLRENNTEITETLPDWLIIKENILTKAKALNIVHFPEHEKELIHARTRLALEELLVLQLGLQLSKINQKTTRKAICHIKEATIINKFFEILPFNLTNAQKKVIQEISKDMETNIVMHRLIQGDVGSGKTIVAAFGLIKAVAGGYQGALMAPTEILAEQHYLGLKEIFESLGIRVALLTGSLLKSQKEEILRSIANHKINIVIGTHALVQENVVFDNLGLVVIDEQHRFGVKQRASLQNKGQNPDLLVMTATPIPRTLAMTLYGDMDVSKIDELPPGRKPVNTHHITDKTINKLYNFMDKEIKKGRQGYVVCPLIDESESIDLKNATELALEYQNNIFPQYRIGLLHSRLKTQEKEKIMEDFRENKIQILVSTTVIEVGVNIPNATMMIIQDAERFGLAQLHQLRGRVGRGLEQSYCFLISQTMNQEGLARLKAMTEINDGFRLAEEDLLIRGPGELLGTKQHGLPDLKVADLIKDWQLLIHAKEIALEIIAKDRELELSENQNLKNEILNKFDNFKLWRT